VTVIGSRPAVRGSSLHGQGIVEYGLILALTSLLTVVWLVVFGGAIAEVLAVIARAIDAATGG
jgi:Flp pilus assembly pilin Flp